MVSIKNRQHTETDPAMAFDNAPLGRRLQAARESLGLDLATAAEQLHLSRSMVTALEEENYEVLPARVFVRGYYRNYARLVGFSEESVLSEFEQRCPEGAACSEVPPVLANSVRKEIRSSHGLVRLATWVIVLGLLAMVAWWWKNNLDNPAPEASVESEPGSAEVQQSNDGVEPASDSEITAPLTPEVVPARAEVAAPVDAMPEPAPQPLTADTVVAEPPEPVAVLKFTGECWIDVRDSAKTFKVVGKQRAGKEIVLDGKPPYKIILGNASQVQLLVNGRPYDLSPYTRGNVAKLTFDPEN